MSPFPSAPGSWPLSLRAGRTHPSLLAWALTAVLIVSGSETALAEAQRVFEDSFAGGLGPGWSWVREHSSHWRTTDQGLEIRVEPGGLWGPANNARNVLVRPLPEHIAGPLEISVTVANQPAIQFEQANLTWYADDAHMVKIGQELVDGQLCVVMGREERDRARTVAVVPIASSAVEVRLVVEGNSVRGGFRAPGETVWRHVGRCDLPAAAPGRTALQCYNGPAQDERWVRFTKFAVRALDPEPPGSEAFVQVNARDPRYFELSDGRPYFPIGLNMIAPPGKEFSGMADWMERLSAQGGNFIRVWLSNPFFDVEHERSGVFDEAQARRIDELLTTAGRLGMKAKLCLEHFRHLGEGRQAWAAKPLHLIANGGTATNTADYFDGQRGREHFRRKMEWYAGRFGSSPAVFGWELWNEINAVSGGQYLAWTEAMLPELERLFPRNLGMQSLGSFDHDNVRIPYLRLASMKGNDVAQVHRYLDLGARLEVCHGPVDVLAADAVRELLAARPGRPVLLAEGGAVEPNHAGPFKLYDADTNGVILHDVLFAPFFAGAAGPGHIWHWDRYVARQSLWPHFGRFAAVVRDLDPGIEQFEARMLPHERLRVYALVGRFNVLLWCRDSQTTWRTELAEGMAPPVVDGARLDLSPLQAPRLPPRAIFYDPWSGNSGETPLRDQQVPLPKFSRSLVITVAR
jgi:regulation of enolase protein 1 (concanavalin A-like superfamily)